MMTSWLVELALFILLTFIVGAVGVGFGIFFVAPRLSRWADRNDEDPGAGND